MHNGFASASNYSEQELLTSKGYVSVITAVVHLVHKPVTSIVDFAKVMAF